MPEDPEGRYIPPEIKEQSKIPELAEGAIEFAPEGWMSLGAIIKKYAYTDVIRNTVNELRSSRPELFKQYKERKTNRTYEFLSPDFIKIIEEKISNFESPPAGWLTANSIASSIGSHSMTVYRSAEDYRAEHPEWFRQYRSEKGVQREYFAPELVKEVERILTNVEKAPEGWITASKAAKNLKIDYGTLTNLISRYEEDHPKWARTYADSKNKKALHVSPDLIIQIQRDLPEYKLAPPGWYTLTALATDNKLDWDAVRRIIERERTQHPEYIQKFSEQGKRTRILDYISPKLAEIVISELTKHEPAPIGWIAYRDLAAQVKTSKQTMRATAEKYRTSHPGLFGLFKSRKGQISEHYAPELAKMLVDEFAKHEDAPEGWMSNVAFMRQFGQGRGQKSLFTIAEKYRSQHPEWFHNYRLKSGIFELYSPELVAAMKEGISKEEAPAGWLSMPELSDLLNMWSGTLYKMLAPFKKEHPDWSVKYHNKGKGGGLVERFSPELVEILKQKAANIKKAPEGWLSIPSVMELTHMSRIQIIGIVEQETKIHPEWINKYPSGRGPSANYLSPELIHIITEKAAELTTKEKKNREEVDFEREVKDIANSTELLGKFKVWVSIFGPHTATDILFAHHPKYRIVPEEFAKGIISDYLGDILVQPLPFKPENLEYLEKRFLENTNLQEGLYICLIQACSSHLSKYRANPQTAANILEQFMVEIGGKVPPDAQDLFLEIIIKVAMYFRSVFDNWKRPSNMIDNIVEGRDFPDTTQIINILEIKEKKRLLIADRMGVGKSASAIAAKEFLALKQALAIVPANVVSTWVKYLSNEQQGGYFKSGQEPKVLVVTSVEELAKEEAKQADYIIISQERLTDEYREALEFLNSDMLIVDEVHKLKSPTGVRSEILQDVAKKFEGQDKYLALLSGTPAPNKVSDIANILKLLYPERFGDTDTKTIARQIIYGDITDLRALLIPRMQRKTLTEVVEMPPLIEKDIELELSEWQAQAYEVILQDDELTSIQKITALRQILLNPEILELRPPPERRSTKIEELDLSLKEHLEAGRNKIVVIFNDYIEGVTRGNNNIVEQVHLPERAQFRIIDGQTPQRERQEIQQTFNNGTESFILYLSGNTADVGIDLSGAKAMIFYNEPWSKEIKAQQLGRCYRPGLKNELYSQTFITGGSIEEGINHYVELKDRAINKLLLGVELNELEQRLLDEDDRFQDEDLEVDPGLATYYLNSFQDLVAMFRSVKNIGESRFSEFLSKYGERYAGNYEALGVRSYQSNVARLNSYIVSRLMGQTLNRGVILDLASGPEMLKGKLPGQLQEQTVSLDINPAHFLTKQVLSSGEELERKKVGVDKAIVSGISNLPIGDKKVHLVNLSMALHYTSFRPSHNDFERLKAISEINRILEIGGVAVVTLQHGTHFKNDEKLKALLDLAGFEIKQDLTGQAQTENFEAEVFCLTKKHDADFATLVSLMKEDKGLAEGLKLKFEGKRKSFKDTRKILTQLKLGKQTIDLELNELDKRALAEEQEIYRLAESLKSTYREIKEIPSPVLRANQFSRIKLNERYILFKSLEESKGVALIK